MSVKKNLSNYEINRYSRQIILPHVGVEGQLKLLNSAVLIVGAGGLGCPCALYLAGAGIGKIGLVDYDTVELNNIHRQILHKESLIGQDKVNSAETAIKDINSQLSISTYKTELNSSNALEIIRNYDVVVDCTDNVATRYLLNDACFLEKKPLVSGSALQMEGQLTVYHHANGPCYRCLFPIPPHPDTVTNCGDGGVLGVIPGTIGVLQALQAINLLLGKQTLAGTLLLFDGESCSFRSVRLRERAPNCKLCSDNPVITSLIDYEQFCQSKANDKNPNLQLLEKNQRISVSEFAKLKTEPHVLVDVRSPEEFAICSLPGSVNIPIGRATSESGRDVVRRILEDKRSSMPVYVICRRGNDSQKAVRALSKFGVAAQDIIGGLHAWAADIDPDFPVY